VRRFVFTPRWTAGHALVVALVVTCLLLGRWQWHRSAETHSLQNYAYALQWPLFAVFFAVMWWRMLRLESRRLDEEGASAPAQPGPEVGAEPGANSTVASEVRPRPSSAAHTPAAQPPPSAPQRPEAEDDPELAAYNRMLAELAARDERR
jgi:DNA-binding transcriptional regulator of glucitol operon